jgi:hypothetical protein
MANDTTLGLSQRSILITGLDANWDWDADVLALGVNIVRRRASAIAYVPSAANDRMIIYDGVSGGVPIFDTGICSDRGVRVERYEPALGARLIITIANCTFDDPALAQVVIILA